MLHRNFQNGGNNNGSEDQNTDGKDHGGQNKLQKLPAKETGKTREEALELLAGDFQEALKKGYSVKEIREILGSEGVTLALGKIPDLAK